MKFWISHLAPFLWIAACLVVYRTNGETAAGVLLIGLILGALGGMAIASSHSED